MPCVSLHLEANGVHKRTADPLELLLLCRVCLCLVSGGQLVQHASPVAVL